MLGQDLTADRPGLDIMATITAGPTGTLQSDGTGADSALRGGTSSGHAGRDSQVDSQARVQEGRPRAPAASAAFRSGGPTQYMSQK
jgi:hypothetical protein